MQQQEQKGIQVRIVGGQERVVPHRVDRGPIRQSVFLDDREETVQVDRVLFGTHVVKNRWRVFAENRKNQTRPVSIIYIYMRYFQKQTTRTRY